MTRFQKSVNSLVFCLSIDSCHTDYAMVHVGTHVRVNDPRCTPNPYGSTDCTTP